MTAASKLPNQASFPQLYEQCLVGPIFRPWAELIVDAAEVSPGDRVLDVACGTGIVGRVAKERLGDTGYVVGVDASPEMLAVALATAPDIDWRAGHAGALPVGDVELFDVMLCQQGLQFFPDKPAAAADMRRALRPGGRLAVSTWRSLDQMPFLRDLHRVGERHLGAIADRRYSFSDAASLETLLRNAGFGDVQSKTLSRTVRFNDGDSFLRLNAMALLGMSVAAATMNPDERKAAVEAIVQDSEPLLRGSRDASGLAFELAANLATARG